VGEGTGVGEMNNTHKIFGLESLNGIANLVDINVDGKLSKDIMRIWTYELQTLLR
jgi:hypothetical protein